MRFACVDLKTFSAASQATCVARILAVVADEAAAKEAAAET
eukprot:CAMPEP_0178722466 /NCGR_PEP_ID=MMETSP0699-20121125/24957_1 /TAXON_ID=265572 /ORGANISM="Extubocellulus spinifer, Strain CCMP396" /LENGTH=40 /DNA_ID= /DNA_START= /DNA_END= /DNA_ORIENTATION=